MGITSERCVGKTGERTQFDESVVHCRRVPIQMARHEQNVFARGEMREKAAVLDDVTNPASEF